ncbi:MAG: ubiquinol-cytochrome c reductase iron-sulfur subunit [Deltaproteobacteria bacterium]|nr:ubiquinol-cytochrome c reductase iron-sulfur subunit [Deltaproteobacteria bacterium]
MDDDGSVTTRRNFLTGCCVAMGAVAVGATAFPAISALRVASDLVFGKTEQEVDLSAIQPGEMKVVGLSLKRVTLIGTDDLVVPVMVLHRKPEWVRQMEEVKYGLKEPVEAVERYINPEWFVARAFCTHLGCTPNIIDESATPVNIVCPCHGGRFDTLGRVISGPPPSNLFLLPYRFVSENRINLFVSSPKDITATKVSDFQKA